MKPKKRTIIVKAPPGMTPEQAMHIGLNTPLPEKDRKRQARKMARATRKKKA